MTTTTDRSSEHPGQYKVVGTRPIRHDALDKVTGAARCGADIHLQLLASAASRIQCTGMLLLLPLPVKRTLCYV
jgi:hypothetical protein